MKKNLNVRCFIQGGGCSGFQYGFTLDEQKDEDHVFETNGIKLLIDPMSMFILKVPTIDYVDDPLNGMFTIKNLKSNHVVVEVPNILIYNWSILWT